MPYGRCEQRERNGDKRQQSADTMETERTTYSIGGADARRIVNDEQPRSGEDTQHDEREAGGAYACADSCGCLTASDGKFGCPNGQDAYDGKLIMWTRRYGGELLQPDGTRRRFDPDNRVGRVNRQEQDGGIGSYGVSLDINYGCPIMYEGAETLKIGTCPGYNNGVMIWRR